MRKEPRIAIKKTTKGQKKFQASALILRLNILSEIYLLRANK